MAEACIQMVWYQGLLDIYESSLNKEMVQGGDKTLLEIDLLNSAGTVRY